MLRSMYSFSSVIAFGLTRTLCRISGQAPPISTPESTSSASAIAGSFTERRNAPTKKPTAQMAAMHIRISFAGSTAFTSV